METNQRYEVSEIDIKEIALVLWNRKWIILLSGLALALAAFVFSTFMITPRYTSTTKVLIITQENGELSYSDFQIGTQLANDYREIITSRLVMEQVIADMNLNYSYESLRSMVTINTQPDTRVLGISVTCEDPDLARGIADRVCDTASTRISEIMNVTAINKIDVANLAQKPVSPNISRNTIIGALAGFILSVVILLLVYFLDDSIKTSDDVEKYLGVAVLGTIPQIETKKKRRTSKEKRKSGRR